MLDALGALIGLLGGAGWLLFVPNVIASVGLQILHGTRLGNESLLKGHIGWPFGIYILFYAVSTFLVSAFSGGGGIFFVFFVIAGVPLCGVGFLLHLLGLYIVSKM